MSLTQDKFNIWRVTPGQLENSGSLVANIGSESLIVAKGEKTNNFVAGIYVGNKTQTPTLVADLTKHNVTASGALSANIVGNKVDIQLNYDASAFDVSNGQLELVWAENNKQQ